MNIDPHWAWARYTPVKAGEWDARRAAHLLRRAAFGADAATIRRAIADGPAAAVERLLATDSADSRAFNARFDELEQAAARDPQQARAWWLRRMIESPVAGLENVTMFWHNRLAVSIGRVRHGVTMVDYLATLRRHALGNCHDLLRAALVHPAVLLGFDSEANRKAAPNLHMARRLLARLGPGEGQFTEADVDAAARAVTGWFVAQGGARFIEREHDEAPRTLLGQRGSWTADDLPRLMLARRATARLLARDLYRWFIADDEAPDALLDPLATIIADGYDMRRTIATILTSNLFHSAAAYRRRIKSPVELAVGLVRSLGQVVPTEPLAHDLAALGQDPYDPPTEAGWPRGRQWLSTIAMLGRSRLAVALLSSGGAYGGRLDPAGHDAAGLIDVLVQNDLPAEARTALLAAARGDDAMRRLAAAIACLPEYQLA